MKTGLFFGSFNPVHIGHLVIANYMIEFTDIEELWFVISPHNPLKDKELLIEDKIRFEMLQSSVEGELRFKVSDVEFMLPKPSYTIDTLIQLQYNYPDREFIVIMGSDGLNTFHLWKDFRKLINDFTRYVYPRTQNDINLFKSIENGIMLNAPIVEISSTFIRQAVSQRKNMRYFVPKNAWNIIITRGLYKYPNK